MSTSTVTRPVTRTGTGPQIPAQRARIKQPRIKGGTTRPVPRSAAAAPRPGSVRLTRRGRIVVVLLLLGLVLGAFVAFSGQSIATGEAGAPIPTRTVVVGEGDTLWEIAAEVAEDGDIREAVHQIEQLNSLSGPALVVGQEIAVPVS
jgi:LysM repeat protein